ncbi:MAG: aminoglycoside nucleotidyltransferase [Chloroflexi bacterium]|nr:MAG: aminoglycoside nucleotidyltransferase [Chloroflexota bacterium]
MPFGAPGGNAPRKGHECRKSCLSADFECHVCRHPWHAVTDLNRSPGMTADDVCRFLDLMQDLGIHVWLDGGWAVDACLGSQTRHHADLDIALEKRDLAAVVDALRGRGYTDVPRDDTQPWNFVLGDQAGHEVDFHVIEVAEDGRGIYGPAERGEFYPAAALTGTGTVNDRTVDCISPEWLVKFHTGYQLDAKDRADVSALCERFGIALPNE